MPGYYLHTGQRYCYNQAGDRIDCRESGQDAEFAPGLPFPEHRFEPERGLVLDRLTGLAWPEDANPAEFPLAWTEALEFVSRINQDRYLGFNDWRLPNRRELRSLISYQTRKPALPKGHPFENVVLGWYWTSTTAAINPAFAWYVHFEGGRMFYGKKDQYYLVWPVRGQGRCALAATGQKHCFDSAGRSISCDGTGQDGELRHGASWPEPRFEVRGELAFDHLTELAWTRKANLAQSLVTWEEALEVAAGLNLRGLGGIGPWRLPTINELESLVDAGQHTPALLTGHPFTDLGDTYCSSTTSGFQTDWCMVLHLNKGAVGVGQKKLESYSVWAVCG